jgi:hypothetical protein
VRQLTLALRQAQCEGELFQGIALISSFLTLALRQAQCEGELFQGIALISSFLTLSLSKGEERGRRAAAAFSVAYLPASFM